MNTNVAVNAEERKRKLRMVFPLFCIPFVVLLFYSLRGTDTDAKPAPQKELNKSLPDANVESNAKKDKMSIYRDAARDSEGLSSDALELAGRESLMFQADSLSSPRVNPYEPALPTTTREYNASTSLRDNEQKVQNKLGELEAALRQQPTLPPPLSKNMADSGFMKDTLLQQLLAQQNTVAANNSVKNDAELNALNEMMQTLLDIQHPERVKERIKLESEKQPNRVFPVSPVPRRLDNEWESDSTNPIGNTQWPVDVFNELGTDMDGAENQNAITAVIHETQTLVSGATVKFRLTQDMYVNGRLIPQGSFVSGKGTLSGERLNVEINTVSYRQSVFPVSLTVYSTDGVPGIYLPGAISRDAAKEGTDELIQSMQLATLNTSIGAQAAATGMEAAKNLLSKKVRLIKFNLKADYPVLLCSTTR